MNLKLNKLKILNFNFGLWILALQKFFDLPDPIINLYKYKLQFEILFKSEVKLYIILNFCT